MDSVCHRSVAVLLEDLCKQAAWNLQKIDAADSWERKGKIHQRRRSFTNYLLPMASCVVRVEASLLLVLELTERCKMWERWRMLWRDVRCWCAGSHKGVTGSWEHPWKDSHAALHGALNFFYIVCTLCDKYWTCEWANINLFRLKV